VLDKTGSLPVSFPVQIMYRIVSYRILTATSNDTIVFDTMTLDTRAV